MCTVLSTALTWLLAASHTLTKLHECNSLYFCNVETNFKISQLKFSSRKCNLMHNFVLSKQSFTKNLDYWKSKFVHCHVQILALLLS